MLHSTMSVAPSVKKSCGEADKSSCDPDWVNSLELQRLSELLELIFYQTVESMADVRWELRRMGQQVGRLKGRALKGIILKYM